MESPEGTITIRPNRLNALLPTAGALLFVLAGIWMFRTAHGQSRHSPLFLQVVAILAIAFFGACALYGLAKLVGRPPELILDREGLVDRSSAAAAGRVAWREIQAIEILSVRSQKLLALRVTDPEKYLAQGGPLRRLLRRLNHGSYATPIVLSATALGLPIQDLERQVRDFHEKFGDA